MINDLQQSFQGLIVSAKPRTSLKNIMIGLGTALAVVGLVGLYASTITPEEQKKSATELAIQADDAIRAKVAAQHPMPSEAEMQAAIGDHKDMLYIPAGPFVKGRLKQEPMKIEVFKTVKGADGTTTKEPTGRRNHSWARPSRCTPL